MTVEMTPLAATKAAKYQGNTSARETTSQIIETATYGSQGFQILSHNVTSCSSSTLAQSSASTSSILAENTHARPPTSSLRTLVPRGHSWRFPISLVDTGLIVKS